jgi:hypothetical protein
MKMKWTTLAVVVMGLSAFAFQLASAEDAYPAGIDIRETGDFRGSLAAYGNWVQTDSYGLCW